jgi:integrase
MFQESTHSPSSEYAKLLWNGLDINTRKGYKSAVKSYEILCTLNGDTAWPATEYTLGKWITARAFGSPTANLGRIKPETIQSYLAALRSHHIDRGLPTTVFESAHIKRLIKGAHNLFSTPKRQRYPITKDILERILPSLEVANPVAPTPEEKDNANVHAAFCLAFSGFLRVGEITHTARELQSSGAKPKILLRNNINFSANHDTATLLLRRSKTDTTNRGVRIMFARTGGATCPVASLRHLFKVDTKASNELLFRFHTGVFTRTRLLSALSTGLQKIGIQDTGYSGHSFRRGAAQQASDNGMLHEEIQTLGRWSSAAFQLYFTLSPTRLRHLNFQFQTGIIAHSTG